MKILDLNLHGYHPKDQPPRFARYKDGSIRPLTNSPFYFTHEELEAGRLAWLPEMVSCIEELKPDIMVFQEVAAGFCELEKPEELFMLEEKEEEFNNRPGINTVIRLKHALKKKGMEYDHCLVCRGNRGWWTTPESFSNFEVVRKNKHDRMEIVWPFGSNPYPTGIVVEGFGILVKKGWEVERSWPLKLTTLSKSQFTSMACLIKWPHGEEKHLLIINVHLGYKLLNIEQDIALKQEIKRILAGYPEDEISVILLGDFNACEKWDPGFSLFCRDFSCKTDVNVPSLYQFNSSLYQPDFNIKDPKQKRIEQIIHEYESLKNDKPMFEEVIFSMIKGGKKTPSIPFSNTLSFKDRIDFIFYHFPQSWRCELDHASILFPENIQYEATETLSDHPFMLAKWNVAP